MENRGVRERRWSVAQSKEKVFWQRKSVFNSQMERVISRYGPVIDKISDHLAPYSTILDVGCGPTCAGQLFSVGIKTYLDPLMDSFLKTYPEKLVKGERICSTAENIPKSDESFDVVLCVNALDHMFDPEKALDEIHRVLKRGGIFVLGIFLHPLPVAMARRFIERWLPIFREDAHPYSYTLKSLRKLLNKFFSVQQEIRVFRKNSALIPSIHREDWMLISKRK